MRIFRDRRRSVVPRMVSTSRMQAVSALLAVAGVMGGVAVMNWRLAKRAQHNNPPRGRFLAIDGVRLHYVERGTGQPLVLLHGNGSMIQDFESSGLIDLAAQNYRVIVFDRPGFGHTSRPRGVIWSPDAQADLIAKALDRLNVSQATVLGHSWGASVALALATRHASIVHSLVLASGYYFPTARADVVMQAGPAVPGLGFVLAYTLAPILSRLMWPAMLRKIFGPRPVPDKFKGFPEEMAVRPSQIRAGAAEAALIIPAAYQASQNYDGLTLPIIIIAGEDDRLIDIDEQSARLHAEVKQSKIHRIPGVGHMVQQSATEDVMRAINEAAAA
jgi:pimeloyl-ACP methyl ester carboxylesterase